MTGRLLVVQLVRYFGCLPCQDWLMQLDGVQIPLFLDTDHQFRNAVGLDKRLRLKLPDPRGGAAYTRSLRGGLQPQHHSRHRSGSRVVILDRHHNVCWQCQGKRIGDCPAIQEFEHAVLQLAMMT